MLPVVTAITATCGRHTQLETLVRCFFEQDYEGEHNLLIYNNSPVSQVLDNFTHLLERNKHIYLINNYLDLKTRRPYTNLGAIYNDAITFLPQGTEVICFMDDDDIFLENHISQGAKGYVQAKTLGYKAYKTKKSYYMENTEVSLAENTFEPSFFIDVEHIKQFGFQETTSDQHLKWVEALGKSVLVDKLNKPTLVYTWGNEVPTFKTSGNPSNRENFNNYRRFSKDHGDKVITPAPYEKINEIYSAINHSALSLN